MPFIFGSTVASVDHQAQDVTKPARGWVVAAGAAGACVAVSMAFVDRPLALWLDHRFRGTAIYAASLRGLHLIEMLGLIGALLLVGGGVWRIVDAKVPRSIRRLVDALAAAAISLALTLVLKWSIGRSQAFPAFLIEHVYAFHPFRTGLPHGAFPSATMAVSSAFLTALGSARLRDRLAAGLVLVMFALAILVTNGHWLSDLIGGTLLGVTVGAAVRSRIQLREG